MEALDLAKYIVNKCIKDECPISNLQLQKILYCIQIDFLKRGNRIFYADFEARAFGVMIPEVYYHYCGYGVMPITMSFDENWCEIIQNKEDKKAIDNIIEDKRQLSLFDWCDLIQKENGAWDRIYQNGIGDGSIISTDLMLKYG